MLFKYNAVILNGVYWLFATEFVFSSIWMFKTFITRVTFITPSHTLLWFSYLLQIRLIRPACITMRIKKYTPYRPTKYSSIFCK